MRAPPARGMVTGMIEVQALTKDYADKRPVNWLSFTTYPDLATEFLDPNCSRTSTTMRIIFGPDAPTSGAAPASGQSCATIDRPMHTVGVLLDAGAMHGGRSVSDHLEFLVRSNGIGWRRVAEVVGLSEVAGKRIRDLMRSLAAQGRTVLVSSRHMGEMALTADPLLIIGRGELITGRSMQDLTERFRRDVFVRSPRRGGLTRILTGMGATVLAEPGGGLSVTGLDTWRIASAAAAHYIPIQELTPRSGSLEDVYRELTNASVEDHARSAGHLDPRPARR